METYTKKQILSVIAEQLSDVELTEMPNVVSELWPLVNRNLDPAKEYKRANFKG